MIRFDAESREINLGARDLIYFDVVEPMRPEPDQALRARAGAEAHRRHQGEVEQSGLRADYKAERSFVHRLERRGYRVAIHGRIDGVYREGDRWVVEEVKSVILEPARFAPGALARAVLEEGAYADYRAQLELYVYFLAGSLEAEAGSGGSVAAPAQGGAAEVIGRLVFRNLTTCGAETVEVVPDPALFREWVESRLDSLIDRLEEEEAARRSRRQAGERIGFPFPSLRPHQGELVEEVRGALERGEHLLVSAPTGVGKTAAVLYAALRHAVPRGLKVFYVTAKTTQQRIVAETLARIALASASAGASDGLSAPPFRSIVLRAREKICPNLVEAGFIHCHEDFCPYAREYAAKVEASGALKRLLSSAVALPEAALEIGIESQACPFELSLDGSLAADLVVGDYNYVFDPESYLRRFFQDRRSRDAILIIDEAHNLYGRGRESYSPRIARREVAALARWARGADAGGESGPPVSSGNSRALAAWCRRLDGLLASLSGYGRDELGDPPIYGVELDPAVLRELTEELDLIRTRELIVRKGERGAPRSGARWAAGRSTGPLDLLGDFAGRWARFTAALEALEGAPFLCLYDKSDPAGHHLRVLCLDPGIPLSRRMGEFRSVIALSATLEPLSFHRDVLGFPAARTRMVAFPSPFPPENRKVLVWNRISTYFRSRDGSAAEVARLIEEIAAVEPGNYLACFSSYGYLNRVAVHLSPEARSRSVVQTPGMSEGERDQVLQALREPGSSRTVLAVQGGIFTEGVDYPGRMLLGAIVVGPCLPAPTFDEEQVRAHFEDRYQEGFEYAYLYPGMNRVIQSAGRVIRSETDVGVIVLLGERFSQSQYARLFPADWYRTTPRELVTGDLLGDLREFWSRKRGG
jgi:DNA excision repair protein ERCC-2